MHASTRLLLGLLLVSVGRSLTAGAAEAPLLRYKADAATNVFSVLIEIRGASGKEILVGNIITFTRPAGSNLISLSLQGVLLPKYDAMSMGYMEMSERRLRTFIHLNEGTEIQMDTQGRIRRATGDFPLPVPLGSLAQSFVPYLPDKAESKWEYSDDLPVLDEPFGLGPTLGLSSLAEYIMMNRFGIPGSRDMSAVLVVSQLIKAQLKDATASVATVQQRLVLDSPLQLGAKPRITASSTGTWSFDLVGGFLRTVEIEFQSLLNSDSSTRRESGKLKIQLLERKEREAALAEQNPIDPTTGQVVLIKLTGDELQKVFTALQSDDETLRQIAENRLASLEVANPPLALVNYLTNYLFDAESPLRPTAVKIVADFGTRENVPDLLRLLKTSGSQTAIRGLGRLKDPRAIAPLVACVAAGGWDAHSAAKALENFGPAAEEQVLGLLTEKHTATRRAACNILEKIGTQKSIEPLKELVINSDRSLSSYAKRSGSGDSRPALICS